MNIKKISWTVEKNPKGQTIYTHTEYTFVLKMLTCVCIAEHIRISIPSSLFVVKLFKD